MNRILSSILLATLTWPVIVSSAPNLIVHEWGTFTSFQTAAGKTIPGINVDDEPVPSFVHRVSGLPIFTTQTTPTPGLVSKGIPNCHRGVTLRLETPVIYFYPQPGFDTDSRLDVRAEFKGGWLTEFYPNAKATVPGFPERLEGQTRGTLAWSGVEIRPNELTQLQPTADPVWTAPRQVKSATVATDREAEKYLFYRGVGHLDAPFVVHQDHERISIARRDAADPLLQRWPPMWLVRVHANGSVWYQRLQNGDAVTLPSDAANSNRVEALRKDIATELEKQGLYRDEAQAMLSAWKLSYFDSEGLRVFFLLPRPWTDSVLPLSISAAAEMTRVMLGRIELVSVTQRAALERLHELPASAFKMGKPAPPPPGMRELISSDAPEALRLYQSLGRFRDPWLAQEWRAEAKPEKRARLRKVIDTFSACSPAAEQAS